MSTIIDSVFADSAKQRVLASGVSLLIAYVINFVWQGFFMIKFREQKNSYAMNKLRETSRVLYLFGVASVFSIYPPYYYGIQCAILSWFTLVFYLLLHIFCLFDSHMGERSVWSLLYFLYHFMIFLWIFISLILAYKWSSTDNSNAS